MKKILTLMLIVMISIPLLAQENAKPQRDFTDTSDEGWYFSNHLMGRYNHFGMLYQGEIFYKKALFREKNNFFFADSHVTAGIAQEFSTFSRTSAYVEFQPLIALKFLVKFTYEAGLANAGKPVIVDGTTKEFNHALPPFTGLNPLNRKPQYAGGHNIYVQFAPTLTIGGPAGPGLIALIYTPYINYIRTFGIDKNEYVYLAKDSIVVKAEDIYFNHDIKLGYTMREWGMAFAINTTIEHMLSSIKDLYRVGLFAAYSYKKSLNAIPSISPFVGVKVGTWLIEKHAQYKFAIQFDAGIEWKFH